MYAHMPIIRDIVYGAVAHGAGLNELCANLGIAAADLNDSDQRLNFKEAYKAWELALKSTGDSHLGLHLGESTNPSILGLVGHVMQSSASLLEAFKNVCQHSEIATNMFQYKIKEKGDQVILQFKPAPLWLSVSPGSARHATEQAMAGTLQVFYLLSRKRIYPKRTEFIFKRQVDVTEYHRVFQSPLIFKASFNQLVFDCSQLHVPVLSYDRSLHSVFEQMLKQKKEKQKGSISDRLRQLILGEFMGQVPALEILASRLNLTTRSLQRRLSDEGITFRALTIKIKNEVASQMLSSKNANVAEISYLLGYSESSAFSRAYKRWNKKTPKQK